MQLLQSALLFRGIQDLLVERLQDQRDGHKDGGPLFPEVFLDRPYALVEIQRTAAVQCPGHMGHHLKGMAQRKERESHVCFRKREHLGHGTDLGPHVPMGEHHTAGLSCRPGGEVHGGGGIRTQLRERFPLFRSELCDERVQRQDAETRKAARKRRCGLTAPLVTEKCFAVGEPQTVLQFLLLQAVVQRYDHPSGGEHGEIRCQPGGTARPEKGDVPSHRNGIQHGLRLFAEAVKLRTAYMRHFFVRTKEEFSVRKTSCRMLGQAAHIGIGQGYLLIIHTIAH